MTMKPYILVVEDEEAIAMMVRYNLESDDFEVEVADDGEKALTCIKERRPDIIVLDWMLPALSGVEVCQQVRAKEDTAGIPIIMLTARGEEADRITGLDVGADDYMVKPFSPQELIARIKAVMRRTRPVFNKKSVEFAGIKVDISAHKVTYDGKTIHLGPTEFGLLVHLMEHPGQVFSRDQLLDNVWGHDVYVENRTVDVHILRLRKALSDVQDSLGGLIQTIRSAGYMLEVPEEIPPAPEAEEESA